MPSRRTSIYRSRSNRIPLPRCKTWRRPYCRQTPGYRIVVSTLGLGMLATVIAVCLLAAYDKKTPDGVIAIGSAAVGALAGLLAPSPAQR
jgi:hypothetical protein